MDLYILTKDKEEYTYKNVICFTFDVVNHDYIIFWINDVHSEMCDRINDKRVKYFNLA